MIKQIRLILIHLASLVLLSGCNSFDSSSVGNAISNSVGEQIQRPVAEEDSPIASPPGQNPSPGAGPPTNSPPSPPNTQPPSNMPPSSTNPGEIDICDPESVVIPDESEFDNVLKDFDRTTTLRLEGSQWDNTLIKNCRFHDVNGDGIFMKNVKNVVITGCTFEDIHGQSAIRTSSTGASEDVLIFNNIIRRTEDNGISIPQRFASGINSVNIIIHSNSVEDTGLGRTDGRAHGIYTQSQGVQLISNHIFGERDGNGLSFRSSGLIACNLVEGESGTDKPGIRYYSDHMTGDPSLLIIERNEIRGQSIGIHIRNPVERYDGARGFGHVVKEFIIRDNIFNNTDEGVVVDSTYTNNPNTFTVTIENN